MKKISILVLFICLAAVSCISNPKANREALSTPVKGEKLIGKLEGNVSITRAFDDNMIIQIEQENGFDYYSMNLNKGELCFDYKTEEHKELMLFKQLRSGQSLYVKQMGNSEENNQLIIKDSSEKVIGKRIAYSEFPLIALSPGERYVVYCAVEDELNSYGLYVYDIEQQRNVQLTNTVDEELLNDMDWNISWSPKEVYLAVSNKLVFDARDGQIVSELKAAKLIWSPSGDKLCFVKADDNVTRTLYVLDIAKKTAEEVFICNKNEFLSDIIVWNEDETKLAFATAPFNEGKDDTEIIGYKSLYSLDLGSKEAIRVDTAMQLDTNDIAQLQSMHYNSTGSLLAFTIARYSGCDLYIYNIDTAANELFMNIEYLHYEDNESYVCTSQNNLYFIQGKSLIEIDERLIIKAIYKSPEALENMYISKDGKALLVLGKGNNEITLRQILNFTGGI